MLFFFLFSIFPIMSHHYWLCYVQRLWAILNSICHSCRIHAWTPSGMIIQIILDRYNTPFADRVPHIISYVIKSNIEIIFSDYNRFDSYFVQRNDESMIYDMIYTVWLITAWEILLIIRPPESALLIFQNVLIPATHGFVWFPSCLSKRKQAV